MTLRPLIFRDQRVQRTSGKAYNLMLNSFRSIRRSIYFGARMSFDEDELDDIPSSVIPLFRRVPMVLITRPSFDEDLCVVLERTLPPSTSSNSYLAPNSCLKKPDAIKCGTIIYCQLCRRYVVASVMKKSTSYFDRQLSRIRRLW